jgi:hypothetical protein
MFADLPISARRKKRRVPRLTYPSSSHGGSLAVDLPARAAERLNALDLGLNPPPGTYPLEYEIMTNIPSVFSSGALSAGTVLPTLGHENYPSSIRGGPATVKIDTKLQ